jgi:hypothetical protein
MVNPVEILINGVLQAGGSHCKVQSRLQILPVSEQPIDQSTHKGISTTHTVHDISKNIVLNYFYPYH